MIKEKFLELTLGFIKKYNSYSKEEERMLLYGLEGLYLTITKLIFILLLALILDIIKEVILVMIMFNVIRYFGFGFHAEKSYECLIFSTVCFIFIPLFFINIKINMNISLIISLFCILNYVIFAPADTVKRPLFSKRKRIIRKILTVLVGVIYTLVIVLIDNSYVTSLILSALVIQFIVINPLTYMLFKQPYNNYKRIS